MKTDVIEKIKYIETHYPISDVQYKGVKIWPFIRYAIFTDYYYSNVDKVVVSSAGEKKSKIKRVWSSVLLTSFITLFKKHPVIIFTDDVGMKKHNGFYIDRIMQNIFDNECNILPVVIKMCSSDVISVPKYVHADFIFVLIKLFSFFTPIKENNFRGKAILTHILSELNIEFDFYKYANMLDASFQLYKLWFDIIKPKKIYVNCYYDMLRMPAFFLAKQMGIPVIEIQHGLITKSHIAYTSFCGIEPHPYPDFLLTFGDRFGNAVSEVIYPRNAVFSVGSYYINLMLQSKEKNAELFYKKYFDIKDKIIITVASQYDIDKEILDFIIEAAKIDTRLFFIFIPRFVKDYHKEFQHDCISLETELDVYQCMQNSHITSAVVSTCAVESLAFGTPVVMLDIKGLASFNYQLFFSDIQSVLYAHTPEEYISLVYDALKLDRNFVQQEGNLFFADNYERRLKDAISKIDMRYTESFRYDK